MITTGTGISRPSSVTEERAGGAVAAGGAAFGGGAAGARRPLPLGRDEHRQEQQEEEEAGPETAVFHAGEDTIGSFPLFLIPSPQTFNTTS